MYDNFEIKKFLGMAVDLLYYHYPRLNDDNTFPEGYWSELKVSANLDYWHKMLFYLEYAITQENYCLDQVVSPFLKEYSEQEIKLFFRKLHSFLKYHINQE